jgi:hypothetical protein
MAFLEIDGIEVDIQTTAASEKRLLVGDKVRTFFGNLRSTYIAQKRSWPFLSGPLTQTEFDTLMAKNGTFVPVIGDFFTEASITAMVTFTEAPYVDDRGVSFLRYINILIEEQ